MSEENKKEAPAKDVAESKPAPVQENEKASKANLIKNLIFAVFIILAIFYCFGKLNKRNIINEANRAIQMYNDATSDKTAEDEQTNYVTLREAISVFEGLFGVNDNNTIAEKITDEDMINEINAVWSKCYSTLAQDPSLSAEESEKLYLKAYGKDSTNLDIPEQYQRLPLPEPPEDAAAEADAAADAEAPAADAGAEAPAAPAAEAPVPAAPAAEAPAAE